MGVHKTRSLRPLSAFVADIQKRFEATNLPLVYYNIALTRLHRGGLTVPSVRRLLLQQLAPVLTGEDTHELLYWYGGD